MKVVISLEALSKEAKERIALETDDQNLLAALSKDEEVLVRVRVAKNENTNELILQELAKDEDVIVRAEVAKNKNTSEVTLSKLANDDDSIVRLNVAGNVQASISTLDQLASDGNEDIRIGVACNTRTSEETLEKLASDKSEHVRYSVISNPVCYKIRKIWEKLSEDTDENIRSYIAFRTSDIELQKKLSEDESETVRENVLINQHNRAEIRAWIVQNSSKESMIFSVLDTFDWPDETLMELIDNLPKKIRLYIAENLTVSEVVLRKLSLGRNSDGYCSKD